MAPFFALVLAIFLPICAAQADGGALAALAEPRTHAILRHALAPGTGDPPGFRLGDCTTQRTLSDDGRAQAREIGQALAEAGVRIDRVLTSRWCRAAETAALLDLGPVEAVPALDSFFADPGRRDDQTAATRALLLALDPAVTALLVSHQVNVTALTGVVPASGELVVFTVDETGAVTVRGRWRAPEPQ